MSATGRFEITLKALLVRDGRALVLRDRLSGQADLPGGRITQAELHGPWLDALRREIAEELGDGVVVELPAEPAFVFPHVLPTSRGDALGMMWIGRWTRGEPVLSDEHDRWELVPLAEAASRFRETLAPAVA
ncbi:MAG TPA: NUDIX domain-containing protein, partial [Myxococcota bacterium]|nr:NUDIX domain-containing protein [Myxococcota bacterium]